MYKRQCYYCGTRPNPEGVRYNGDWEIWVQELDLRQMKLVGESMAIWKGAVKGVIWPEGPHLYKIDGYYYLMHAEGGTGPEHSISIARSKKLFQWFEGCPRNPIFTHRNLGKNYPVIYAGHGDLVEDGKGNWYVVMLASRPCEGHSSMGRETFLAKVTWENGWPVIAEGVGHLEDTLELPTKEYRFPEEVSSTSDHISFWEKKPDKRLVSVEEICEENYSLSHRPGMLRLYTKKEKISDCNHCSYFGIRQKNYAFYAETGMEFEPKQECETAGMVLYQNHENHLRMEIRKRADENYFVVTACIHGEERILTEKPAGEGRQFFKIRMHCDRQKARIWLFRDGREMLIAEDISLLPYTTEEAGGFVGCTIGMYASANGQDSSNYADFAWFVQNAV